MLDFLLNIPYYFGKDADLVAVLREHAPTYEKSMLFNMLRYYKRGTPRLTVAQLQERLKNPPEPVPLLEAKLQFTRERDGATLVVDSLWSLEGHVLKPYEKDEAALLAFLDGKAGEKVSLKVFLAEDEAIHSDVTITPKGYGFSSVDTEPLKAWYRVRYPASLNRKDRDEKSTLSSC